MPEIPEGKHRPNMEETVVDLLESIALEEMALAHMMNAEGERVQAVVKHYTAHQGDYDKLQESCYGTQALLNSFIMKEWLLFSKLNAVLAIFPQRCAPKEPPPCQGESIIRVPTVRKCTQERG